MTKIITGCYNKIIVSKVPCGKSFTPSIKPQCRECRYSEKVNDVLVCTLFKESDNFINVKDARNDNNLCGIDAYYFKK